ncbi:MAG: pilus assembly protein PilQ, partial [Brevinematia bacterium]
IPPEVIRSLGKEVFDEVVLTVKNNASNSAKIEADKNTYTIYVKDQKDNISKIKNIVTSYLDNLKKQAEDLTKLQKEKGQLIRKDFEISYENYKALEDKIIENLSPFGRYNYDSKRGILTIFDTKDNILNVTRILGRATKEKIETKCFYARGLEPGEIITNIKENFLSENGIIIFKSKETTEVVGTDSGQLSTSTSNQVGTTSSISRNVTQPAITLLPRICITDKPEIIEKIRYKFSDYLLDRPYQISIEARIVEISSNSLKDLGIQWGGLYQKTNTIVAGTSLSQSSMGMPTNYAIDFPAKISQGQGFALGFVTGNLANYLDIRLSALQRVGKSKLLSAPKILTTDGEPALIRQGFEIPYTTGATATTPGNVNFKNAVMQLKVTPFSMADGNIVLNIELSKDEPDFARSINGIPAIKTKTVVSRVAVKDGSTIVIGGIIEKKESENESGVPGLMNIPLLGYLFKNNYKSNESSELLIFISPKIVYE